MWNNSDVQGCERYKFMRKLVAIKSDFLIWNQEVFGNVRMRLAELENKIWQLDEKELEVQGSDKLAIERKEIKCALENLVGQKNQIDNQKTKVNGWVKAITSKKKSLIIKSL